MKTHKAPEWSTVALSALLLASMCDAQAAVGTRVLMQDWKPQTPATQNVRVVADNAGTVSDAMQMVWSIAAPQLCGNLVGQLGTSGAATGEALRDIKCRLDETPAFTVTPVRADSVSAWLAIGGRIEATSGVPGSPDRAPDSRHAVTFKATLHLTLAVQADPAQALRVDAAKFVVTTTSVEALGTNGNASKPALDNVPRAFKGPAFKPLAVAAAESMGLKGYFNGAMGPINARLTGPAGAVRVAVWGRPDAIVVADRPRDQVPPAGGPVTGALRWDVAKTGPVSGCGGLSIIATVQTGPAPLRDPEGGFDASTAPTQTVGSFQVLPGSAAGECRYRMSGLAAGWPNQFLARSQIGVAKMAGAAPHHPHTILLGDGWDGRTVVPQPSAERNYRPAGSGAATAMAAAPVRPLALAPANPLASATNKANKVSLNPQPLPPGALPTQVPSALR